MILIMGSSHDDLLYFESIIKNKQDGLKILNKYPAMTGTIFNQNVILVHGIYTSYVSSAVTSYIIREYRPVLAIMVGKCRSISSNLKVGDIAVSRNVICIDVNQGPVVSGTRLGEVPGFNQNINQSVEIINTLNYTLDKLALTNHFESTYLCSNTVYVSKDQMTTFKNNLTTLNIVGCIVTDSESGGAAIACNLFNIPFVSIKVVDTPVEKQSTLENYIKVIGRYSALGKAVISFIGEIGRNDLANK